MRHSILLPVLALAFAGGASALDLNVDLGVGGEKTNRAGSAVTDAWGVEVCRAATEAQQVKIEVAVPGSKDRDTLLWNRSQTRNQGDVQDLALPSKFRDLGKVWVQGTADPKNSDVLMAVTYGGKPKRIYSFKTNEKHEVSIKDPDTTLDCPTG